MACPRVVGVLIWVVVQPVKLVSLKTMTFGGADLLAEPGQSGSTLMNGIHAIREGGFSCAGHYSAGQ